MFLTNARRDGTIRADNAHGGNAPGKDFSDMSNSKAQQRELERKKEQRNTVIMCVVAVVLILAAVLAAMFASGVFSRGSSDPTPNTPSTEVDMNAIKAEINSKKVSDFTETTEKTEYVKITVKDHGDIVVRLRADVAPKTVANYQKLVGQKFYDGLTFHRVYKGFMIQGGDPKGNGTGGSDEKIKGEFSVNGVDNKLSHVRGVISMARSGTNSKDPAALEQAYNSASCQFFICHADSDFLDGQYASFGYVVAGLETVDSVANVTVTTQASSGERTSPVSPVVIEKIVFVKAK